QPLEDLDQFGRLDTECGDEVLRRVVRLPVARRRELGEAALQSRQVGGLGRAVVVWISHGPGVPPSLRPPPRPRTGRSPSPPAGCARARTSAPPAAAVRRAGRGRAPGRGRRRARWGSAGPRGPRRARPPPARLAR